MGEAYYGRRTPIGRLLRASDDGRLGRRWNATSSTPRRPAARVRPACAPIRKAVRAVSTAQDGGATLAAALRFPDPCGSRATCRRGHHDDENTQNARPSAWSVPVAVDAISPTPVCISRSRPRRRARRIGRDSPVCATCRGFPRSSISSGTAPALHVTGQVSARSARSAWSRWSRSRARSRRRSTSSLPAAGRAGPRGRRSRGKRPIGGDENARAADRRRGRPRRAGDRVPDSRASIPIRVSRARNLLHPRQKTSRDTPFAALAALQKGPGTDRPWTESQLGPRLPKPACLPHPTG